MFHSHCACIDSNSKLHIFELRNDAPVTRETQVLTLKVNWKLIFQKGGCQTYATHKTLAALAAPGSPGSGIEFVPQFSRRAAERGGEFRLRRLLMPFSIPENGP